MYHKSRISIEDGSKLPLRLMTTKKYPPGLNVIWEKGKDENPMQKLSTLRRKT